MVCGVTLDRRETRPGDHGFWKPRWRDGEEAASEALHEAVNLGGVSVAQGWWGGVFELAECDGQARGEGEGFSICDFRFRFGVGGFGGGLVGAGGGDEDFRGAVGEHGAQALWPWVCAARSGGSRGRSWEVWGEVTRR